jgi:hypothetical protein
VLEMAVGSIEEGEAGHREGRSERKQETEFSAAKCYKNIFDRNFILWRAKLACLMPRCQAL